MIYGDFGAGRFQFPDDPARERQFLELEWLDEDPFTFTKLINAEIAAIGLRRHVDPATVRRFRDMFAPRGAYDELRAPISHDGLAWGMMTAYRFRPVAFDESDEQLAGAHMTVVARELRRVMLRQAAVASSEPDPPGLVLLDADGAVVTSSASAESLLGPLDRAPARTALTNLAAGVAHEDSVTVTIGTPTGLVRLYASPATSRDGSAPGGVAVVVERPRRAELAPIILRSLGLTPREREVTELLLAGLQRKQIADRLGVREDSVGDHVKAIYRKAGVDGRPELYARVYGEFFQDRRIRGDRPGAYGYFAD